ncbi:hypothetical protein [Variovorax sp. DAIF25]|uniref:hypothetical protein n=1 Tax=Variovorax sp. DAIF25 TaxID=3080983 RepID=UPI003D6BF21C
MTGTVKLIAAAVVLGLLLLVGYGIWQWGGASDRLANVEATADGNAHIEAKQRAKTRSTLKRAAEAGELREQDRAALDALFQRLSKEAANAPTAADDRYVLPDDRLQLWRAANAGGGPDRGTAAGQPDHAPEATAAAGFGRDSGAGSESPRGGEGLPRPGLADVSPPAVPAALNGGL